MKTLDEHNRDQRILHSNQLGAVANGIACPKCGNEMYDTNPTVILPSKPPQKTVGCGCGYSDYRIA